MIPAPPCPPSAPPAIKSNKWITGATAFDATNVTNGLGGSTGQAVYAGKNAVDMMGANIGTPGKMAPALGYIQPGVDATGSTTYAYDATTSYASHSFGIIGQSKLAASLGPWYNNAGLTLSATSKPMMQVTILPYGKTFALASG